MTLNPSLGLFGDFCPSKGFKSLLPLEEAWVHTAALRWDTPSGAALPSEGSVLYVEPGYTEPRHWGRKSVDTRGQGQLSRLLLVLISLVKNAALS